MVSPMLLKEITSISLLLKEKIRDNNFFNRNKKSLVKDFNSSFVIEI